MSIEHFSRNVIIAYGTHFDFKENISIYIYSYK